MGPLSKLMKTSLHCTACVDWFLSYMIEKPWIRPATDRRELCTAWRGSRSLEAPSVGFVHFLLLQICDHFSTDKKQCMITVNYQAFGTKGFQLRLRLYQDGETRFVSVTKLLKGAILKRNHDDYLTSFH